MSKRFGRNQKRKMRELIENLSDAEKMSRELAKHYSDALGEAIDEIEDAKCMIGNQSALFSPQHHRANFRTRHYEVAMMPRLSPYEDSSIATYKRIRLPIMLLDVENRDGEAFARLGDQIHMRLHFADNTIGYACAADTLRHMGVNRIAHEMARLLHDKLQKALG